MDRRPVLPGLGPVPALGVGQHVRRPRAHGRKGPKPKYIHVLCIQPNSKSKEAGRLPVEPSSWGRQFGIAIAPDSAPGSPSALGGRRLVWSGVSASRAGALGTGHRRHWFVVSRKELQALLYSSPIFVRSCLRPGRIRTPGNH